MLRSFIFPPNKLHNEMIHMYPLKLENVRFRCHDIIGVHELNGKIVYVHGALGDELQDTSDNKTVCPNLVIADSFTPDFAVHTQTHISYKEEGVFYAGTCAKSYVEEGRLFLNTYKTVVSKTISHGDNRAFKKLFEITDSEIREILPHPRPEEELFSHQKTYRFGDYVLHMASDWKLECRSAQTDTVLWILRLTSYLYTELEEQNGILYFGTAGKGGFFYGVSLNNGQVIFKWDTGHTTRIVWGNDCVIITDRKGNMVLINPTTGIEIKRLQFRKMGASTHFPFLVRGNSVYTVLYNKKDIQELYAAYVEI